MKQRGRWLARHATISVRSSCHDTFKQAQHASDPWYAIQCGNKVHFRGAGIGKTCVNAALGERMHKALCAVHATATREN